MDGVTDATHAMGNLSTAADPKQQQPSAFQIAVSVAHAAEHKVRSLQAPLCVLVWFAGEVVACVLKKYGADRTPLSHPGMSGCGVIRRCSCTAGVCSVFANAE
jgi:hypothetical protein